MNSPTSTPEAEEASASVPATAADAAPGGGNSLESMPSTSAAAAAAVPPAEPVPAAGLKGPPPFGEEEKIYEDENVEFFVKRNQFLRQKKFSLETFLFRLTANRKIPQSGISPEQGPQYLVDFCSAIEASISKLFSSLRDYYQIEKAGHDHQVYIALKAVGLTETLRVGNFGLEGSNPEKVARMCTTYLYNILNSGRTVNLNIGLEGFEIDMKAMFSNAKVFFLKREINIFFFLQIGLGPKTHKVSTSTGCSEPQTSKKQARQNVEIE